MNGPEHYREAEQRLAQAHAVAEPEFAAYLVAKAQAHATLALVAAQALPGINLPAWRNVIDPVQPMGGASDG